MMKKAEKNAKRIISHLIVFVMAFGLVTPFARLQVSAAAGEGRVLLTGTAFGRTDGNWNPAECNPENAFDGREDTIYRGGGGPEAVVGLDLGEGNLYRLASVRIRPMADGLTWESDHCASHVQGSVDGVNWINLGNIPSLNGLANPWWTLNLPAGQPTFRYFRLQASTGHLRVEFRNLEFYGYIPCEGCDQEFCVCCPDCDAWPCVCPCFYCNLYPCDCYVADPDALPGEFLDQIFNTNFSNGLGNVDHDNWTNSPTVHYDSVEGDFIRFPAGDSVAIIYLSGWVPVPGDLYVLTIRYRTDTTVANRLLQISSDNTWMMWPTVGRPMWAELQMPRTMNEWGTAYLVFEGQELRQVPDQPGTIAPVALRFDRMWNNIGHGLWDVAEISINKYSEANVQSWTVDYVYGAGASGPVASETVVRGRFVDLPLATRANGIFLGWYTESNGGGRYIGYAGDSYLLRSDITLYAHFEWADQNIVSYDLNGGTNRLVQQADGYPANGRIKQSDVSEVVLLVGESTVLPNAVRLGHAFDGWFDGDTRVGGGGNLYAPSSNVILKAGWTPISLSEGNLLAGSGADFSGGFLPMNVWSGWEVLDLAVGAAPNGSNAAFLAASAPGGIQTLYWQAGSGGLPGLVNGRSY
ncbi:MAG: InlB B-repeat-containing protein, partial [Defluviitaleaceae bacterium]|nr:InlB B-repeat-containing protein [Defluviitaleaceae bacterium]